ncbi:MAG: PilN domain-containing protein, partial [Kiloniellaceae bacterium]
PFKSQEVYFDFRIKGGDAQRKRIKVDLVVIPRAVVDRAVRVVNGWGLDLNGAELAGGAEGAGQAFDLLPSSGATAGQRLRRRLYGAAALTAVVVAIAVAYLPLRREEATLTLVRGDLKVARAAAAEVDRMRRQVADLKARSRFVVDRKRRQRSVTEILDEVTRRLPDRTWALKFVVRDRQITVSGYSAKPSALIAVLEESEMMSGARFSSPVTMDQKVGLERFNLTAEITPREGQ